MWAEEVDESYSQYDEYSDYSYSDDDDEVSYDDEHLAELPDTRLSYGKLLGRRCQCRLVRRLQVNNKDSILAIKIIVLPANKKMRQFLCEVFI